MDDYNDLIISLEENEIAKRQAMMNVKIKLAENLEKSNNSYMGYKKFSSLSSKSSFVIWRKNFKTESNTIPLC